MHIDRALLKASWQSWLSSDNHSRVGPGWMQWMWTLLFSAVLALPFTLMRLFNQTRSGRGWLDLGFWLDWYGRNLIVCVTIGVLIHVLFNIGGAVFATRERVAGWGQWQRRLYFSGMPLVGVAVGWPVGMQLAGFDLLRWAATPDGSTIVWGSVIAALLLSLLFHQFFESKARQIGAEKRATEAQLRLLQAQIEPHFLFNTLANVLSLIDHDTPKAKQMLQAFTEYLRSSLVTLRHDQSPLGHELELAENYLRLLATRMEGRLHFSIDASGAVRRQPLPPLLLQPLVENAVHHGLEPTIDGGSVHIRAYVQDARVVLEVQDDGRGPDAPSRSALRTRPGSGMALANIRQRLLARYGGDASLEVSAAHPGTLARIVFPLSALPPAVATGPDPESAA